jgi:predicted hydrocarbon binding protein
MSPKRSKKAARPSKKAPAKKVPPARKAPPKQNKRRIADIYGEELLDVNPSTGYASFMDSRIMLIRPETMVIIHKSVEERVGFDAASMILYEAGKAAGRMDVQKTRDFLQRIGTAKDKLVDIIVNDIKIPARLGLCFSKVDKLDKKTGETVFRVENAFSTLYGQSSKAVCCFLSGHFAGSMSCLYGAEFEAVETKCVSKGDEYCEFRVMPKELFQKRALEFL